MAYFERLSALDATFLGLEDERTHMHVAATLLFDAAPLRASHGGLDIDRIRAFVESRLAGIPRYRQRLAWIPLEGHPVWIDDARFNLFYHVRHTALPRPGEERQLKRLCGRILSQKLDLTKPLWEFWVVEGVADDRFALIAKVHHAMVDGIAGMDLLIALLSAAPQHDFTPAPPWRPRPAPGRAELLLHALERHGEAARALVRKTGEAVRDPVRTVAAIWETVGGIAEALAPGNVPASPTPLNPDPGPHRRFDWLPMDLRAVKEVKRRLGGTINDVVLATVAGAVRRYLRGHGVDTRGLDFRAMVPVSLRRPDERGRLTNRVANFVAALPVGDDDPLVRYRRVVEATTSRKASPIVRASELVEEVADWTSSLWLTQLVRFAAARRAYNIVVTNVPGPQAPLYLLEAPLRAAYPMVPLFHNQGVGIALFSYDGGLFWGVNADWDAVPDLHDLVEALRAEFDVLRELAVSHAPAA